MLMSQLQNVKIVAAAGTRGSSKSKSRASKFDDTAKQSYIHCCYFKISVWSLVKKIHATVAKWMAFTKASIHIFSV